MRNVRVLTILRNVADAVAAVAAVSVALASCSPKPRDVSYYRLHAEERRVRLTTCRADRGRLASTADCINALAADSEDTSRKFWTTPPPASRLQHPNTL